MAVRDALDRSISRVRRFALERMPTKKSGGTMEQDAEHIQDKNVINAQLMAAYYHDRFVYRVVVCVLSALALTVTVAAVALLFKDPEAVKNFPVILTALGSASLGALAGILAPQAHDRR